MGRESSPEANRDLFSPAKVEETSSPSVIPSEQKRRHVLPKDLPNAIKHLDDQDLDRLLAVAAAAIKQPDHRTVLLSNAPISPWAAGSGGNGLPNAVRAASKAGVKPSLIARQFGLSRSDIRKVLAMDTAEGGAVD